MALIGLLLMVSLCQIGTVQHNILLVTTFFTLEKSGKQQHKFLELLRTELKVHGLNLWAFQTELLQAL